MIDANRSAAHDALFGAIISASMAGHHEAARGLRLAAQLAGHPNFPKPERLRVPPTDPVQRAKYDALWASRG